MASPQMTSLLAHPVARRCLQVFAHWLTSRVGARKGLPGLQRTPDGSVWVMVRDHVGLPTATVELGGWLNNPYLASEADRSYRTDVAMEMMGDDVYGLMVFMLKRTDDGPQIAFRCQSRDEWLQGFTAGFARVMDEAGAIGQS